MTVDELTDAYKFEVRPNPTHRHADASTILPAGHHPQHAPRVQLQPDDGERLLEPGRARRPLLRAGERSRLHPAARRRLRAAHDPGPAPFFSRFDIGLTKRFPIKDQVNFELRFDMLNVFDNVNFLPNATAANNTPGAGGTSSRPRPPTRI